MLSQSKVIVFIPTHNREAARRFYEGALGLRFVSDDAFALVFDSNGIMIRLVCAESFEPRRFTIAGWEVADIGAAVTALRGSGVVFEQYGMPGQDESGIWAAPGGAKVAWFKDPDGNVLSISEHPAA